MHCMVKKKEIKESKSEFFLAQQLRNDMIKSGNTFKRHDLRL